jgi:hypothetical protein
MGRVKQGHLFEVYFPPYLTFRFANSMKKGEKVTNKYRYQVKCPERILERYLDDMGVLIVDFFDTQRNQTVGTSKIMMKLYVKR